MFLYLLFASLFYFLRLVTLYSHSIAVYGVGYLLRYYLPKILPIFLFSLYLGFGCNHHPRLADAVDQLVFVVCAVPKFCGKLRIAVNGVFMGLFLLSFVTLAAFLYGAVAALPITTFLGAFTWSYTALVTWNAVFIIAFSLIWWKTRDPLLSAVFATLVISAGGILYELPLYPTVPTRDIYFHATYPLVVATKWLSLVFLGWLMRTLGWRLRFVTFAAAWLYVMFSVVYVLYPTRVLPVWLPRLPAAAVLLTLPSGIAVREKLRFLHKKGRVNGVKT